MFVGYMSRILVKGLLCARGCPRCRGCNSEQNGMASAFMELSVWILDADGSGG